MKTGYIVLDCRSTDINVQFTTIAPVNLQSLLITFECPLFGGSVIDDLIDTIQSVIDNQKLNTCLIYLLDSQLNLTMEMRNERGYCILNLVQDIIDDFRQNHRQIFIYDNPDEYFHGLLPYLYPSVKTNPVIALKQINADIINNILVDCDAILGLNEFVLQFMQKT